MPNFDYTAPSIVVSTQAIARWFRLVRDTEPEQRDRILECFWDTQLSAKAWLILELSNKKISDYHLARYNNVYIFGGWYGILASMMRETAGFIIEHLYSIDIDPQCEAMVNRINYSYLNVRSITSDMAEFTYPWEHPPTIVINTSTEHVEQGVYDTWYDKIPRDTIIVAQGNNYFDCSEHVRCSKSLNEFKIMNHVIEPLYEGELPNSQYTRYMCIWRK
jgi:hypothetical protein